MNEEIKEDNNCIVKAFENNPISIIAEEINNKKIYLFKVSDIGNALKLTNIRVSIQNYDEGDEVVVRKAYDTIKRNQDTLYLTSQGVYRLLYNSKKEIAKKFRKWAGNILDDIIFNESVELKRQLEEKDKQHQIELQEKNKQLSDLQKLKVKKWYNQDPGDTIYAIKINSGLIKIGKTKNIKDRETHYVNNQVGNMFHIKKCFNCDLTEKVLHHILDKYRVENNKEWFQISEELSIYLINIVCDFLDNFINFSEELPNSQLLENLNKSLEIVKNLSNHKDEIKIHVSKAIKTKPETESEVKPEVIKENVYDFIKFFKDKCEIGVDYECSTYDIYGAYRLWSKIVRIEYKNELTKYLNDNYKKKRKYFKDIKTSMVMYSGFRVKPFIITQENPNHLPKYEEFILQNCDFGYNNKISVDNFMNEMKKWFKNYPDYVFNIGEERHFRAYINRHFLRTNMKIPTKTGTDECNGIWGIKLKNSNIIKKHKQHSRKIIKVDINTNEILEEYDSILMIRDLLNVTHRKINDYIDMKLIFDNKYKYEFKNKYRNK
jgi:prophage antirepressor-like protein